MCAGATGELEGTEAVMRRASSATIAIAASLFAPPLASAQSAIDGTWKTDPSTLVFPARPLDLVLSDGRYECRSCTSKLTVAADGKDHKLENHPAYDTFAVKVVSERVVEIAGKKAGKLIDFDRFEVAADGKTMIRQGTRHPSPGGETYADKMLYRRVSPGPTGANRLSGSWRVAKVLSMSDTGHAITYQTKGNTLHITSASGASCIAPLDGTFAPCTGDPVTGSISVKMPNKNTLVQFEKAKRDGKVYLTATMKVAANGKTAKITWKNLVTGDSGGSVSIKR
jgi:hypothetical protein